MRRTLTLAAALGLAGCTAFLDPASFLGGDGGAFDGGGIDGGGVDGGDGSDAGACRCRDADAVCTVDPTGAPICQRPGVACTACPAGYACGADAVCECADSEVCGVECAGDADCGSRRCDVVRGVCRPPLGCLNYLGCPDFGLCVDLRCVGIEGDVPAGGACRVSDDCFDGLCRDGFCRTVCLYNDDCGGSEICGFEPGSSTPFCMPPSSACSGCTDFLSTCSSAGECLMGCEEQIDCDPDFECVLSSTGFGCRPSSLGCGDGEVVIDSAGACALPLGCYTADEPACQSGFECRSEESLGLGNRTEVGFCVRSG